MVKLRINDIIIFSGVILGVLDWVTDAAYAANAEFQSSGLKSACTTFVILQPAWYFFMFIVYIASHEQFESMQERKKKFIFAFHYTFLQQFKMLANFERFNQVVYNKFPQKEQFLLFNLENSFRVQIGVELILETFPQIIIQASNNKTAGWSGIKAISFFISLLLLIKNVAMLTIFGIRKFIEHRESVSLRPTSYAELQTIPKLDNASKQSMLQYQVNPSSEALDVQGNTEMHNLVKEEFSKVIQITAAKFPHQLFMLNKHGQTPLDVCIEDYDVVLEKTIEPDGLMSHRNESDLEKGSSMKSQNHRAKKSRRNTGKVVDESQTQMIKVSTTKVELDNIDNAYETRHAKSLLLMKMMQRHSVQCSIKYLRHPQRLDLKFERSYTMAVKKNRTEILSSFPRNSIKTVYVSTSQLKDLRQFKAMKRTNTQDIITTPLHLACQTSNVEAARILLTNHDYDVNILLYEKNFIYDLLTTGGYQDFSILSNVFKKRKPCVNSGCKMPLNQAILRGNQYIIQTMLEHGSPNPYAKDINGFTPVHFACAKLDWETFEDLVRLGGDPLLPDHEGNTFLHLLCDGGIKDVEYDFAKMACQQFNLRLTRNNQGKTALGLLGSMRHEELYERSENLLLKEVDNNLTGAHMDHSVKSMFGRREFSSQHKNYNPEARGQPNYKSKLWDYLKSIRENDPTFEDHEGNSIFHMSIIKDEGAVFDQIMEDPEFIREQLNLRNVDGKSPLFLAIEHGRRDMFDKLFAEKFLEHLDLRSKDTIHGNTPLHIACEKEEADVARKIFEFEEELCMQPNFQGRSPFFVACQRRNLEILRIFEEWKTRAIMVQDYLGENMLFVCAREGDVEIFNWFGGSNNFYRARGQQNYKGHTIEHIVCIAGKTGIVEEIRPKLDTKDYYGNLPLHYTFANDDEQMVRKYFTNGKAYFDLRNFKYETIFHTAAKHDSEASMKALLGKSVFIEELVKRDFKGDTPLHTAAKAGSLKILQLFLTASTPAFLELQNDFGLTPLQAAKEKISLIYEKIADLNTRKQDLGGQLKMRDGVKKNEQQLANEMQRLDKDVFEQQKKLEKTQAAVTFIEEFESFVTNEEWNQRFEIPLAIFLEMCVDPNLRVFMGMNTRTDVDDDGDEQKNKEAESRKALYSPSPAGSKKGQIVEAEAAADKKQEV